jgi:hypothetical protein
MYRDEKIIFFILCLSVLSCKKEMPITYPSESVKSDRLIFKDFKEYCQTDSTLSKMTSITDLQFWAQKKGHSTLLFDTDSTLVDYPPSLKTILNKDSEFQIGDSIVWFHSGNLYSYSKDANYIEDLKRKPETFRRSGYIKSSIISSRYLNKTTIVDMNTVHPDFQYQFYRTAYQPCGGTISYATGLRKWVTEVRDVTATNTAPFYYSTLYIVIKLEWKVSSWKESLTEQKNISYNIGGTIEYHLGQQSVSLVPQHFSEIYSCSKGNQVTGNLWVNEANYNASSLWNTPYWVVNLSGGVTQQILGDSNPPYYTAIYW